MKFQKQKYTFIAILTFLATSCGSSGGGGGSSSPQNTPKPPTTNNPEKPGDENTKPDVDNNNNNNNPNPPDNGNNGGGNNDNNSGGGNDLPNDEKVETISKDINITSPSTQGVSTNNRDIISTGNIHTTEAIDTNLNAVPILAKDGFTATNNGKITGKNKSNENPIYGMMGINDGNLKNTGDIKLLGHNLVGLSVNTPTNSGATNSGNIDLKIDTDFETNIGTGRFGIQLVGIEGSSTSKFKGDLALSNSGKINIDTSEYKSTADQVGNLNHFNVAGIYLDTHTDIHTNPNINNQNSHSIMNTGNITVKTPYIILGQSGIGIYTHGKNITTTNNGNIDMAGIGVNGIFNSGENSKVINKKNISIVGDKSAGIYIDEIGSATNEPTGTIVLRGDHGSSGMFAESKKAQVINKGKINVTGETVAGIRVSGGATGINDTTGVITVGDSGFGMYAESGSKIENNGQIILNGSTKKSTGMYATGEGSSIVNSGKIIFKHNVQGNVAIEADNEATYINSGEIIGHNNVTITGDELSKFIIGTKANGTVGTVSAKSIKIDGNVVASKSLIKSNQKHTSYKDVFVASTIEMKKDKPQSVSLFYDSKLNKK